MKCGYAKRKWWAFVRECEEFDNDYDVFLFFDWLYQKGCELVSPKDWRHGLKRRVNKT